MSKLWNPSTGTEFMNRRANQAEMGRREQQGG